MIITSIIAVATLVSTIIQIRPTEALQQPLLKLHPKLNKPSSYSSLASSSSLLNNPHDDDDDNNNDEQRHHDHRHIVSESIPSVVPSINRRRGLLLSLCSTTAAVTTASAATYNAFAATDDDDVVGGVVNVVETKSPFIAAANTIVRDTNQSNNNPLDGIDWNKPKKRGLNMEQLSDAINDGLVEKEWFVTGNGLPEFFSENFVFEDPQVSLVGYQEYCRGVRRLFDQDTARCELVCCSVTAPNTITVLWRNSGKVNIGGIQIELKPYLVTTTFKTDPNDGNLIVSQVDEFESDPLGLLLYQVPFLRSFLSNSQSSAAAPSVNVLKQQCDFYTCKIVRNNANKQ